MTKINFKNNKTKIITTTMASLVIGFMLLSPTAILPEINAQTMDKLPPGKAWTSPQPVETKNVTLSMRSFNDEAMKKAGYIATPIGYLPPECVREVGNNAHINQDGSADLANGTHLAPLHCSNNSKSPPPFPTSNWVEDASVCYCPTSPPAIKKMSGAWTVPPNPTTNNGQIIYLWIGLQPSGTGTAPLIQPVLEWNYGSSGNWQIASWYCTTTAPSSCQHATSVYATSPGKTITGTMTGSSCNTSTGVCNWSIQTTDGTNTSTVSYNSSSALYWLDGAVLEVYGVTACSDYPAEKTNGTPFNSFLITDTNGNSVSPSWTGNVLQNDGCNESVGITGTQATLYYGN